MKSIFTLFILFMSLTVFSQQMTWTEWEKESLTNIRLLPKYGDAKKNKKQKKADKALIKSILEQHSTHRKGSEHLIDLGFKYLYKDIKMAMYRFNQAYLLDPTNTDIYWGYGAIYMTLENYEKAKAQYEEGLKINPENTRLLTDYGTYFMIQYFGLKPVHEKDALVNWNTAITQMAKSYKLDPTNENTTFKLSVLYWAQEDCDNAWKYYDACMKHGGQPISAGYTTDLMLKCEREEK